MEQLPDYFERAREAGVQGEILRHLSEVPLFAALNEAQLVYLASQMQGRTYAPYERIFEQGSTGQDLYVVLEGTTELRLRYPDGIERTVARVGAGRAYGEIGLVTGEPRNLAAVNGDAPGLQLVLTGFDFERVLALQPDIGQGIYRRLVEMIAGRMRELAPATRNHLMWGYGTPAPLDMGQTATGPPATPLLIAGGVSALLLLATGSGSGLLWLGVGALLGAGWAELRDPYDTALSPTAPLSPLVTSERKQKS